MDTQQIDKAIDEILPTYDASSDAVALLREVTILLLVGISGAGKDTIKRQLLETGAYHRIVTHTTRLPRENHGVMEQDGLEYHFVDKATMLTLLENHGLIEANRYAANVYAASVAEFRLAHDEGKIAVADIDVNGVANFKRLAPASTRPVFLLPPSFAVWRERWLQRYGDGTSYDTADYQRRLKTAIAELTHVLETPYYFIVVNDELDAAVREVDQVARKGTQADATQVRAQEMIRQLRDAMQHELAQMDKKH